MRVIRSLALGASGMKSAYAIVFTGLMLYELIRFRFKKGRHAEIYSNHSGRAGH